MGIISAAGTSLGMIKETEWGTTPSTPAFQLLRFLPPENFKIDRETITSNEHTADRNVSDLIVVSGGASGGFGFELSYGTYDDILASALFGAWTDNVLINGSTESSFTFERKMPTGEATAEYLRFLGMVANNFSLSMRVKEIVNGTFEFLGMGGAVAQAAIASSTYVDATETGVMNAVTDFAAFSVGSLFTDVHIMGIDMNITNNLRAPVAMGSVDALGIGYGRFEVTGSMDVYFENSTALEAFLDNEAAALSLTIGSVAGKKYTIEIPVIKFATGEAPVSGNDEDMMLNLTWQGLRSSTIDGTMKITRAVA